MPSYPGMPYGPAPAWCFPLFEYSMYLLFLFCLAHAIRRGPRDVSYLLGGLVFGLLLELMEVFLGSYTYGRFTIMLGKAPNHDIPLCIGVGWGIIMYTARLFSERLYLSIWACAALDTLLAINIDLSMDIVAYRLHMWHWDWSHTGLNPLTAQWFGIPFGNFVGWQTVVFCYAAFSRLWEKIIVQKHQGVFKYIGVALLALVCSIIVLYTSEEWLFPQLNKIGVRSMERFIGITIILLILLVWHKRKKAILADRIPRVAWWVPAWFHLLFFALLFIMGFYTEQVWMVIAASANLLVGILIHIWPVLFRQRK